MRLSLLRHFKATGLTFASLMNETLRGLLTRTPSLIPKCSLLPSGVTKVLGDNVVYIVAGVVIEDGKVLMIQEAKPSCRGQWCLPVGTVGRKESLVEAVKREVKEEAGLDFEPNALVQVESYEKMSWIRFTFSGEITGGKLKTTAEANEESLQAGWFTSDVSKLPLEIPIRFPHILPLISATAEFRKLVGPVVMPTPVAHTSSLIKFVVVRNDQGTFQVLHAKSPTKILLPLSVDKELTSADFALEALKENGLSKLLLDEVKVIGVLSVEHNPQCKELDNSDGVCLTLLVSCDAVTAKLESGAWVAVEDTLVVERLRNATAKGTSCIQLCNY